MRSVLVVALAALIFSLLGIISGDETESQFEDKTDQILHQHKSDHEENAWKRSRPIPVMKSKTPHPPLYPHFPNKNAADIHYEPNVVPPIFTTPPMSITPPVVVVPTCFGPSSHGYYLKRFAVPEFEENNGAANNNKQTNKEYSNLGVTTANPRKPLDTNKEFYLDVYIDKSRISDIYKRNSLQNTERLQGTFLDCMNIHYEALKLESMQKEISTIVLDALPVIITEIENKCTEIKKLLMNDIKNKNMNLISKEESNMASNSVRSSHTNIKGAEKDENESLKYDQQNPSVPLIVYDNTNNVEKNEYDDTVTIASLEHYDSNVLHNTNHKTHTTPKIINIENARIFPYKRQTKNKEEVVSSEKTYTIIPSASKKHFPMKESRNISEKDDANKLKQSNNKQQIRHKNNSQEKSDVMTNKSPTPSKGKTEFKIAIIETHELRNGSVITKVEGISEAQKEKDDPEHMTKTVSHDVEVYPILSGHIVLRQEDNDEIPLYFTQSVNGKLNINIDSEYICQRITKNSVKSKILKAICKY